MLNSVADRPHILNLPVLQEDAVDSLLHDSGNRNDDRLLKAAALQQSLDGALATLPSRHAAVMRCLYDPERRKAPVQREVSSAVKLQLLAQYALPILFTKDCRGTPCVHFWSFAGARL